MRNNRRAQAKRCLRRRFLVQTKRHPYQMSALFANQTSWVIPQALRGSSMIFWRLKGNSVILWRLKGHSVVPLRSEGVFNDFLASER